MIKEAYAAIVIAAGLSERMGMFKPLLEISGKPALLHLLDSIRESGIETTLVVTGHERSLTEAAVNRYITSLRHSHRADNPNTGYRLLTVNNKEFKNGMFSSVKTGFSSAAEMPIKAALLFPADVPLVSEKTIAGLIRTWEQQTESPFAVPVYEGKNGHPLLIPAKYFDEILSYKGEGGLKGVRSLYDKCMIRYETEDAGCVLDIDTPEDYAKLLAFYAK